MSYKDDIESIKSEIVGEGRFLEYYMHFEKYYKKYKFVVWGVIFALIFGFAYNRYSAYQAEQRVDIVNTSLNKLLKDPTNKSFQEDLKAKSPKLYTLVMLNEASRTNDKEVLKTLINETGLIGKVAKYQLASIEGDGEKLQELRVNEGATLKDFSILQTAYTYIKSGETAKAKEEVAKLPFNSQFKTNADIISHFGVGK